MPSAQEYTKVFRLRLDIVEPQPPIYSFEDIHFTGTLYKYPSNSTYVLNLTFLDDNNNTLSSTLVVTAYNFTTNTTSTIGIYTFGSLQTWTQQIFDIDRNMTYYCNVTYHHQFLWVQRVSFVLEKQIYIPITSEQVDTLFDWLGLVPFGACNFLMWLLFTAICYYTDERDAGKIIIVVGVLFLFLGVYIGIHTPLFGDAGAVFGGAMPALLIALGVLMEWNKSKKRI